MLFVVMKALSFRSGYKFDRKTGIKISLTTLKEAIIGEITKNKFRKKSALNVHATAGADGLSGDIIA
jgi:hypothetical protein